LMRPTLFPYTTLFRSEVTIGEELSGFFGPAEGNNRVAGAVYNKGGYMHMREMFFDVILQGVAESSEEAGKAHLEGVEDDYGEEGDRKSTRLNSSHDQI